MVIHVNGKNIWQKYVIIYIAELYGKKEGQDIDPDIIINSLGVYWYIEK